MANTLRIRIKRRMNLFERFAQYAEITDSCWLRMGTLTRAGYGHFDYLGKTYKANRLAYEFFKGKIPSGLVTDHLCRTPCCVNPNHLEAVTQHVNFLRSPRCANYTPCPHGVRLKPTCKICKASYMREFRKSHPRAKVSSSER